MKQPIIGHIKLSPIRLFLSAFLFFTLLGCEKEDVAPKEFGGVNSSCYITKSDIYQFDTSPERRTANTIYKTVKLKNGEDEIAHFQIKEGTFIVLPDIRARYCKYQKSENSGKILTGWNDGTTVIRPGQKYRMDSDVTFEAEWESGIEIYTAGELDNVSDNLTQNYKLMRNIDLRDYMAGSGWNPIGDEGSPFKGKFYGNNYIIDNLTIGNTGITTAGLFGAVGGTGAIYDLTIVLSAEGIKLHTVSAQKAVGTLAGYIVLDTLYDNVTIENVKTLSGSGGQNGIQIGNSSFAMYAGGIVGAIDVRANSTELNIINSSNSVALSAQTSNPFCNVYLGGIIGANFVTSFHSKIVISDSENHGDVTSALFEQVNIGGITGNLSTDNNGSVELDNCANSGAIQVNLVSSIATVENPKVYAGGIAGNTNAKINRCINEDSGAVSIGADGETPEVVSEDPVFAAGGIAGLLYDNEINESRNSAPIYASSKKTSNTPGNYPEIHAGGLCGNSISSSQPINILKSINNGSVKVEVYDNISNVTDIYAYAGGLLGYASPPSDITKISDSYNTGAVFAQTSSNLSATKHRVRVGGIAGALYGNGSIISNTYNLGTVTADAVTGEPTPPPLDSYLHAGGIAGYLNDPIVFVQNNIQLNSIIEISPPRDSVNNGRGWIVGGGTISADVIGNYRQNTGFTGDPGSDNGTFVLAPDFDTYDNDLGFDFTDTWVFDENEGRPVLQWE